MKNVAMTFGAARRDDEREAVVGTPSERKASHIRLGRASAWRVNRSRAVRGGRVRRKGRRALLHCDLRDHI
jgi:hypothetical protein